MLLAAAVLATGCAGADADARSGGAALTGAEAYDAALDPLRRRSDVLEERFAEVQRRSGVQSAPVREVLEEIVPEYARLLEDSRSLDVEGDGLERAHEALLASLEAQQDGLELALEGVGEDDPALLAEAADRMAEAQALLDQHRRLLEQAKG